MFKIGFAQFSPTRCDVTANVAAVERLLHGVEADLLVLPELANSGYLYASPEALSPFSEPGDGSGPFLSALQRLAGRTGGVIVAGFSERAPGGAVQFGGGGRRGRRDPGLSKDASFRR